MYSENKQEVKVIHTVSAGTVAKVVVTTAFMSFAARAIMRYLDEPLGKLLVTIKERSEERKENWEKATREAKEETKKEEPSGHASSKPRTRSKSEGSGRA